MAFYVKVCLFFIFASSSASSASSYIPTYMHLSPTPRLAGQIHSKLVEAMAYVSKPVIHDPSEELRPRLVCLLCLDRCILACLAGVGTGVTTDNGGGWEIDEAPCDLPTKISLQCIHPQSNRERARETSTIHMYV